MSDTVENQAEASSAAMEPRDSHDATGGPQDGLDGAPPVEDEAFSADAETTPSPPAPRKTVLLIEPDGKVRGSVVALTRHLEHVTVYPAINVALGDAFMKGVRIQGLLLSVADGEEPLAFLAQIRRGEGRCDADVPVVAMALECDATLAARLKEYGVSRLLLQPFKLGDMAHTLELLWEVPIEIPPQPAVLDTQDVLDPVSDVGSGAGTGSEAQAAGPVVHAEGEPVAAGSPDDAPAAAEEPVAEPA